METNFKNKYEHFKVNFKGLVIEVKLLDSDANFPNSDDKNFCEEFKVLVTNKEETIIFKFYNSIMEREISKILNTNGLENVYKNLIFGDYGIFRAKEFKNLVARKFMWGGYDKVKNLKSLTEERIYNLLYSILNDMARDIDQENESFQDFCDNFGYDADSIRAERIYKAVLEQRQKIESLCLNKEQKAYFREHADQETEKFSEDVRKAIIETKTI